MFQVDRMRRPSVVKVYRDFYHGWGFSGEVDTYYAHSINSGTRGGEVETATTGDLEMTLELIV